MRIGVRSDTLALSDPSVVGSTGFQRCELRAADQALFDALLDGASREERSALLALALETWTPRTGPSALAGERLHQAALACATDGACDDVRAMVVR